MSYAILIDTHISMKGHMEGAIKICSAIFQAVEKRYLSPSSCFFEFRFIPFLISKDSCSQLFSTLNQLESK